MKNLKFELKIKNGIKMTRKNEITVMKQKTKEVLDDENTIILCENRT